MKNGKHFPIPVRSELRTGLTPGPRSLYSCSKCPAYCCSYPLIEITKRDLARLARHFSVKS